jgi:hypothetical protein
MSRLLAQTLSTVNDGPGYVRNGPNNQPKSEERFQKMKNFLMGTPGKRWQNLSRMVQARSYVSNLLNFLSLIRPLIFSMSLLIGRSSSRKGTTARTNSHAFFVPTPGSSGLSRSIP